jgi:hypothetical protein
MDSPPEQSPGHSYYRSSPPDETWIGDRIYVYLQVVPLLFCCGLIGFSLLGTSTQGRLGSPGGSEGFILAVLGCTFLLYVFVWQGMWNGRKWAYIVDLVLCAVGLVMPMSGNSSGVKSSPLNVLVAVAHIVFAALRLGGAAGPPLNSCNNCKIGTKSRLVTPELTVRTTHGWEVAFTLRSTYFRSAR